MMSDSESAVRATEESRGGLKYELVLAEPADVTLPPKLTTTPPKCNLSAEGIKNKLKAAEERRQFLEAQKLNQLSEKRNKEVEVNQKKQEYNSIFMEKAQKDLEQKMEEKKENREAFINSIKEKSRHHVRHAQEVRQNKVANLVSSG
ncbi:stathmin-2-like isoform X2 [Tachypleus tridentatus]|uniref:stathmin-2-like isoform X2 n=1 Tax=Tachypleus tridentatus TaxID=6853 RepID=UPI003FCF9AD2